jgi:RNA polymerase sigma-B factor
MTDADAGRARFAVYRRTRDRRLRDELIAEHAGLARAMATRYAGRGESLDDLTQVAMLGLFKAVERFEPERGLAFSTFATPTITGELKRHFRDHAWSVRVPRSLQELAQRVTRTIDELSHSLGSSPSVDDVAAALDVSVEEVLEAMEANRAYSTDSLDVPREDATVRLEGAIGEEDAGLEQVENRMIVADLLDTLPERERTIIRLRFEDGLTQSQIAARVGISQMHVSRLLSASLAALRERLD